MGWREYMQQIQATKAALEGQPPPPKKLTKDEALALARQVYDPEVASLVAQELDWRTKTNGLVVGALATLIEAVERDAGRLEQQPHPT